MSESITVYGNDYGPGVRVQVIDGAYQFADRPLLDALSRPVPEWAREAFDVLAKDGRRVFVGGWQHGRHEATAATLNASGCAIWGDDPEGALCTSTVPVSYNDPGALADAARRALAMEAERSVCTDERCAKKAPGCCYRNPQQIEVVMSAPWTFSEVNTYTVNFNGPVITDERRADHAMLRAENAKADASRRYNATCPRCHGPAYHGFNYAPTCERVGGCLADREPRILGPLFNGPDAYPETADVWREPLVSDDYTKTIGEEAWTHRLAPKDADGCLAPYATRDHAITAWREALLARAKAGAL